MTHSASRLASPPRRIAFFLSPFACLLLILLAADTAFTQRRRASASTISSRAIVIDERLAALRSEPDLSAPLVQRLGRGRDVTITGTRRASDGVTFHRVAVTRNTRGWMQTESLASGRNAGDDERLLRLVRGSEGFDRIERARIFLELFPRSTLRPQALLLFGDAAASAAERLTRDAARRLDKAEMAATPAPPHSFMLNFQGIDRFNREGIRFTYEQAANRLRYDGASWREIVRRYPQSDEAAEARKRLAELPAGEGKR